MMRKSVWTLLVGVLFAGLSLLAPGSATAAEKDKDNKKKVALVVGVQDYDVERLKLAKSNALVMHPGPMNEGVEIAADVAHGAQSVIETQVANGVAIRMALLYLLAGDAPRGAANRTEG